MSVAAVTPDVLEAGGLVAGDQVIVNATGVFRNLANTADDWHAGTQKLVRLSSSYTGTDRGNYTIADQLFTTASITPRTLTFSTITAADKVYDANTQATVDTSVANSAAALSAAGRFPPWVRRGRGAPPLA